MAAPVFVGRARTLDQARRAVASGLHVHLEGEAGVGKTALARRVSPDAVWVATLSPASEVIGTLLVEAYKRGWWEGPPRKEDDEGPEPDEAALLRGVKKLGQKAGVEEILKAFALASADATQSQPVVVLDDFERAPAAVVRIVRSLSAHATIIAVTASSRPHHKPFLFHCSKIEVKRLSNREGEELARRLVESQGVALDAKAPLVRFLVEEAQGLPKVMHEIVRRGTLRGDLSLQSLRREDVNGFKTVDMTPGLMVIACGLMMFRGVARGWGDHDWTVFVGASGAIFMLFRFFAFRLSRRPASRA